jgi:hypothetical protein
LVHLPSAAAATQSMRGRSFRHYVADLTEL